MQGVKNIDRISSFVQSFYIDDEGKLGEIYKEAKNNNVPVIRPETRELLKTQLLIKKPANVLEIGTAVGYSALFMSDYIACDGVITTIELDEERYNIAKENIKAMNREEKIVSLKGDAAEVLKTLPRDSFDFAFVDAAKGQYIYYLESLFELVKKGGVIFSDNILQDGDVLESHFTVDKRNRTIHDRMREYLYILTHDERLETAILSVADGVAISYVK